jgi:hypothetical protein
LNGVEESEVIVDDYYDEEDVPRADLTHRESIQMSARKKFIVNANESHPVSGGHHSPDENFES